MRKPCANCRCLKGQHGIDVEPVRLSNGMTWYRYLHPCLTAGCHCANYQFAQGLSAGYGKGDGILPAPLGETIRHIEKVLAHGQHTPSVRSF